MEKTEDQTVQRPGNGLGHLLWHPQGINSSSIRADTYSNVFSDAFCYKLKLLGVAALAKLQNMREASHHLTLMDINLLCLTLLVTRIVLFLYIKLTLVSPSQKTS